MLEDILEMVAKGKGKDAEYEPATAEQLINGMAEYLLEADFKVGDIVRLKKIGQGMYRQPAPGHCAVVLENINPPLESRSDSGPHQGILSDIRIGVFVSDGSFLGFPVCSRFLEHATVGDLAQ